MGKWLILGGLIVLLAAGCGGASTASKTTTATSTTGSSSGGARSAAFTAFQDCLKQHGVTGGLAFRRRAGGAPPQGQRKPPTAAQQKALQACRSKLPPGQQRFGPGGRRGAGGTAFAKYTACLRQHGVTFGASSSGAKFRAASAACAKLRPKVGG
jgi:hypothetical protein